MFARGQALIVIKLSNILFFPILSKEFPDNEKEETRRPFPRTPTRRRKK